MNSLLSRFAGFLAVSLSVLILTACAHVTPLVTGPGTTAFLDAGDFTGRYKGKHHVTSLGGQSTYLGRTVFTNLDRSMVAAVLPTDLQLAANVSATPNLHPVVLLFGTQKDTAWVLPWATPPIGRNYQEVILLIPFVQKDGKDCWHNYVVRMYLNEFLPTLIGNQYYGYQKRMAAFTTTATDFNVHVQGVHMFKAQATTLDGWSPHATAIGSMNNYAQALEILSMPILGTLELVPTKPHVCSYFEWNMDSAQVRSITSSHAFVQSFVGPQMDSWVAQGNLSNVAEGAFELKGVQWRVQYPPKTCRW